MEFRALGPLEVLKDGEPLDLGPPKQRTLLALLLIHANEVVSTDRILDALWGSEADGKENALWVHVSRLRSALEPDRVERGASNVLLTRDPGYKLVVDLASYDVARFEKLVSDGQALKSSDPATSGTLLAEALALWRGAAFDEFRYEEFAHNETARLDELRIAAIEDRIEADLGRGLAGELVSELEVLREQHPLRERPVANLMLALYRSGRPAEALRAFGRFEREIGEELGIGASPELKRLEEQILLHDDSLRRRPTTAGDPEPPTVEVANPFKGLRPFLESDADVFFGRDALVADLLRALGGGQRLVALVGASGSGKSSVVRAGLVPALAKGALPGSDSWLIARMVPGAHPFAEAEAALLRSTFDPPQSLSDQLGDGDVGLLRAVLRVLPDDESHLVLVIDQFEELFTLVDDAEVRDRFLANLVTALDEPHRRVSVVVTLRADFYGRPLNHPAFGARLSGSVVNVTPLSAEELEAAAVQPAAMAGVSLEPALLGQLIADVGSQAGALPLFQYTLTELFDRRVGATLTAASYRAMGGLDGALSRRAGDLHDRLDPDQQEAARQLFLRLVNVTEHDERSRRRARAAEIVDLGGDIVAMQEVIGRFGRHRLLSFDADRLTGSPTVEVAHESLLTAWPLLGEWIDEARDDLRRHASFNLARHEWLLAERNPDYLLAGTRLGEAEQWAAVSAIALTATEREFLDAGIARRKEEETAEASRRRQAERDRRVRRRLWALAAALAAFVGVAAFLLFAAFGDDDGPTVAFFGFADDGSWGENIAAGLDRAATELDLGRRNVAPTVDPAQEFRALAGSGADLIVTDNSPTFYAPEVFSEFPDVNFALIDGFVDSPNALNIRFANEQGAFLAGAAAALASETGTVGFVGATLIPTIEEFRAGFEAGARHIDPGVAVLAIYIEERGEDGIGPAAFGDVVLGERRATRLYEEGADVVFHAAGHSGFGVFDAAARQSDVQGRHLWAIGVDNDQWFQAGPDQQPHILTSLIKRGDVAAHLVASEFADGEFAPGVREIDASDGAFQLSTQGSGLTPTMLEELESIEADLATGRITVPSLPSGELLVPSDRGDLAPFTAFGAGTWTVRELGIPVTFTVTGPWRTQPILSDFFVLSAPGSVGPGDRDVVFVRPTALFDVSTREATLGADDLEAWRDTVPPGVSISESTATTVDGLDAETFDVAIGTDVECTFDDGDVCLPFVMTASGAGGFEKDFRYEAVWIHHPDGPMLVVSGSPDTDDAWFTTSRALIDTIEFG